MFVAWSARLWHNLMCAKTQTRRHEKWPHCVGDATATVHHKHKQRPTWVGRAFGAHTQCTFVSAQSETLQVLDNFRPSALDTIVQYCFPITSPTTTHERRSSCLSFVRFSVYWCVCIVIFSDCVLLLVLCECVYVCVCTSCVFIRIIAGVIPSTNKFEHILCAHSCFLLQTTVGDLDRGVCAYFFG